MFTSYRHLLSKHITSSFPLRGLFHSKNSNLGSVAATSSTHAADEGCIPSTTSSSSTPPVVAVVKGGEDMKKYVNTSSSIVSSPTSSSALYVNANVTILGANKKATMKDRSHKTKARSPCIVDMIITVDRHI